MANEIWCSYDSAKTLYAFVYRQIDNYIYDVGDTTFEAIGTWDDTRAGECDIAMTASGDMHFADFPTVDTDESDNLVAAGIYVVSIRERLGASPDTDDPAVAQGILFWDGSAEINTYTIDADVNTVLSHAEIISGLQDETLEGKKVRVVENM